MNRVKDFPEHASSKILHQKPTPQNAHNKRQIISDNMQQDVSDGESRYTPPLPAGLGPKRPRCHSGKGKSAAPNQYPNKHRKHQEHSGLCNKQQHRPCRDPEDVDHPRFPVVPANSPVTQKGMENVVKGHQMIPLNTNRIETLTFDNKNSSSQLMGGYQNVLATDRQAYANQPCGAHNDIGKAQPVAVIEGMHNRTDNRYPTPIKTYTNASRAHPNATGAQVLYVNPHFKDCSENGKNQEASAAERMHNRTIKADHPPSKADTRAGGDHRRVAAGEQIKDHHRCTNQKSAANDAIGKVKAGGVWGNDIGAEIPFTNQYQCGKHHDASEIDRMHNHNNKIGDPQSKADTKAGGDHCIVNRVERNTSCQDHHFHGNQNFGASKAAAVRPNANRTNNQHSVVYDQVDKGKDGEVRPNAAPAEIPYTNQNFEDCVEYGKGEDTSVRGRIYNRNKLSGGDIKTGTDRRNEVEQNISAKSSDRYNNHHSDDEGKVRSSTASAVPSINQRRDDYDEIGNDKDVGILRSGTGAEALKPHQHFEDFVEYGKGQDTSVGGRMYNRNKPSGGDIKTGTDRRNEVEQNISGKSSDRYNNHHSDDEGKVRSSTASEVPSRNQRRDDYDEIGNYKDVGILRSGTGAEALKPHQHVEDFVEYGKGQDTSVGGRMYNRNKPSGGDIKTGTDRRNEVKQNISGKLSDRYNNHHSDDEGKVRSSNASAVPSRNQRRDDYDEIGNDKDVGILRSGTGAEALKPHQHFENCVEYGKGQDTCVGGRMYNRNKPSGGDTKTGTDRRNEVEQNISGKSSDRYNNHHSDDEGKVRSSTASAVPSRYQRRDDYDEIGNDKDVGILRSGTGAEALKPHQHFEDFVEYGKGQDTCVGGRMYNRNKPSGGDTKTGTNRRNEVEQNISGKSSDRYNNHHSDDERKVRSSTASAVPSRNQRRDDYDEIGNDKDVGILRSGTGAEDLKPHQHFEDFVEYGKGQDTSVGGRMYNRNKPSGGDIKTGTNRRNEVEQNISGKSSDRYNNHHSDDGGKVRSSTASAVPSGNQRRDGYDEIGDDKDVRILRSGTGAEALKPHQHFEDCVEYGKGQDTSVGGRMYNRNKPSGGDTKTGTDCRNEVEQNISGKSSDRYNNHHSDDEGKVRSPTAVPSRNQRRDDYDEIGNDKDVGILRSGTGAEALKPHQHFEDFVEYGKGQDTCVGGRMYNRNKPSGGDTKTGTNRRNEVEQNISGKSSDRYNNHHSDDEGKVRSSTASAVPSRNQRRDDYDEIGNDKDVGILRSGTGAEALKPHQHFENCVEYGKGQDTCVGGRMYNRNKPSGGDTKTGTDRRNEVEQNISGKSSDRYNNHHSDDEGKVRSSTASAVPSRYQRRDDYDEIGNDKDVGILRSGTGAEALKPHQHFEDFVEYGKGQDTCVGGRMYNRNKPSGGDTKTGTNRRNEVEQNISGKSSDRYNNHHSDDEGKVRSSTASAVPSRYQRRDDYDEIGNDKDVGILRSGTGAEALKPHQHFEDFVEYGKGQDTCVGGRMYNRNKPSGGDTKTGTNRRNEVEQNISGKSSDRYNNHHSDDERKVRSSTASAVPSRNQRRDDYDEIGNDKDVGNLRSGTGAEDLKPHQHFEDFVEYGKGQDTSVGGRMYNRNKPSGGDIKTGTDRRNEVEQNISGKSSDRYNNHHSDDGGKVRSSTASAVPSGNQRRDGYDEIGDDKDVRILRSGTGAEALKPHQHFEDCVEYGKGQDTSVGGRMYNRNKPSGGDTKTGTDRRNEVEQNISGKSSDRYNNHHSDDEGKVRSSTASAVPSRNQQRDDYDEIGNDKDVGILRSGTGAEALKPHQHVEDFVEYGKGQDTSVGGRMYNRNKPSGGDTKTGTDRRNEVDQNISGKSTDRYNNHHSDDGGKVRSSTASAVPSRNQRRDDYDEIGDDKDVRILRSGTGAEALKPHQHFEDCVEYGKGQDTSVGGRMYNRNKPSGGDTKTGTDRRNEVKQNISGKSSDRYNNHHSDDEGKVRSSTASAVPSRNQRRDDYDEIGDDKDVRILRSGTGAEALKPHQHFEDCVEYGKGQDTSVGGRMYNRNKPSGGDTKTGTDRRNEVEQNISGKSSDRYNNHHSADERKVRSSTASAVPSRNQRRDDYDEIGNDKDVGILRSGKGAEALKPHQHFEDFVEYGKGQDTSVGGRMYSRTNPIRADTKAGADRRSTKGVEENVSGQGLFNNNMPKYSIKYYVEREPDTSDDDEIVEDSDHTDRRSSSGSATSSTSQRYDDYDEISDNKYVRDGSAHEAEVKGEHASNEEENEAKGDSIEQNVEREPDTSDDDEIVEDSDHADRRSSSGSATSSTSQRYDDYDEISDNKDVRDGSAHEAEVKGEHASNEEENEAKGDSIEQNVEREPDTSDDDEIFEDSDHADRRSSSGSAAASTSQGYDDYDEISDNKDVGDGRATEAEVEDEHASSEEENEAKGDSIEQNVEREPDTSDDDEIGEDSDHTDRRSSSGSAAASTSQGYDDYDEISDNNDVKDSNAHEAEVEGEQASSEDENKAKGDSIEQNVEREPDTSDDGEIGEDSDHTDRRSSSGSAAASTSQGYDDYDEISDNNDVKDSSATEAEVEGEQASSEEENKAKGDSIEQNISPKSSQLCTNQQSVAYDKTDDPNDRGDGHEPAELDEKAENVVEVPPTNDFLDGATGNASQSEKINAANSHAPSITRFNFSDDSDFKKQMKLMVEDTIKDILDKPLQGEENQAYLNLLKEIDLRNKTSSQAATNIGKKVTGTKISGKDLSAKEVATIKVLTPLHDKLQRMYVKHRRDEISIIEDLISVPSVVKNMYLNGIEKKKKK